MMISNLPKDLIKEILSRIPLKSMRAFRLTCKKWNALSKSQSFMKLHIGKAEAAAREEESQMIVIIMDYNLYYMSCVFFNGICVDSYTENKGKLIRLNDSNQVKISRVFHSDGLLLCILKDKSRLVVWNPYLGKTRWIEFRHTYSTRDGHDLYKYAIGYENKKNKSCRSHKILRFTDFYNGEKQIVFYEIYDFGSGLWTTLDIDPDWYICYSHLGLSLKGNTYWSAREKGYDPVTDYIVCFDFTREIFVPLSSMPLDAHLLKLSCVKEEKLAALFQTEIWITTKIEVEKVSWSKFLTVDPRSVFGIPIWFSNGFFFIDEEKKVAMVYKHGLTSKNRISIYIVGEAGYFREVYCGEPASDKISPFMCSYVPSLVQI